MFNVLDEYKGLTVEDIKRKQPKIGASLGMINVTNDLNLGMSIRTATLFGFDEVHVFGRRKIDRRPLVGCHNYMDIHRHYCMVDEDTVDCVWVIDYLKENGYYLVACDTDQAMPIRDAVPVIEHEKKARKPIFLMGNEGNGLPKEICDESDISVFIEQNSVMRSLNVSAAASIIMYEYYSQVK